MLVAQKRVHLIRRQTAAKRGGGKAAPKASDQELLAQALDSAPTPELAAQVVDECRRLLGKLGDEELKSIAVWQMEGHTVEEIAQRLACSPRTVARKLAVIRDLWRAEGPCP
jgi:DNA-directed RNA polymerase specialized sigma24 family protein